MIRKSYYLFHDSKKNINSRSDNSVTYKIQGKLNEIFIISTLYEEFDKVLNNSVEVFAVVNEINFLDRDLNWFMNDVIENLKDIKIIISKNEFKFNNILSDCIISPCISSFDLENKHEILFTPYYFLQFIFNSTLKGKFLLEEIKSKMIPIFRLFNILTKQECNYNLITIKYLEDDKKKRIEYNQNLESVKTLNQNIVVSKVQYLEIINQMYKKIVSLDEPGSHLFKVVTWRLIKSTTETDLSIRIALFHTTLIQLLKYLLKDRGYKDFINTLSNIKKVFKDLGINIDDDNTELISNFNRIRNKIFKNITPDYKYDKSFYKAYNCFLEHLCLLLNKFFDLNEEQSKIFLRIFKHVHCIIPDMHK
ncbi:MAG: hypothetical protein M3R36_12890 [Bacteroidota bacterium]|nr:hypothetical protein [Bacteroidota bacterium]